jgi:flagellar hook-basal body complex protein FliE
MVGTIGTVGTSMYASTSQVLARGTAEEKKAGPFEGYLFDAMNYVNETQNASNAVATQVLTDPDSVSPHDVTVAMAKAEMTLSVTQAVLNRVVTAWNEITTTR